MKCLRCNSEMKQYKLNTKISVYESIEKPYPYFGLNHDDIHSLRYAYVCDYCGYVEFNMGFDDDDLDI